MIALEGRRIAIQGIVQGVGFRPWVYRIARRAGIAGRVSNDSRGVTIEAFGPHEALDTFLHDLKASPPPAARIRELSWESIPPEPAGEFQIVESRTTEGRRVSIPPDLATCEECAAEIFDPANRRYRYPFTNCTNCGPRFTITCDVPYDRPVTTMAGFTMCPDCRREYDDPENRRFHAQPNACPVCGPRLSLLDAKGSALPGPLDALADAARSIRDGAIVAIKGLGGFHLACLADDAAAVLRLRERKRRDEKPFAVMAADLWGAARLAILSEAEKELLTSVERPIVLVPRREDAPIADEVAPNNPLIGLLLAYTPLHHLLLADVGRPLVMTSANLSDEPICYRNEEAVSRLAGIADLFLVHDREIETRCDDSVARVIAGRPALLRRSRGWVPRALPVLRPFAQPVFATGAELKDVFCVGMGGQAFLGPHIGDLDQVSTLASFEESAIRMQRFLRVEPKVIAHDLHPGYASTAWARRQEREGVRLIGVQHHHAHVASAMVEHGLAGPVLGLAWDGTGYGTDGTAWGGELLFADLEGFRRLSTLRPIPLAGGERAIRAVWRIALALLDDAFGGTGWPIDSLPLFQGVPEREIALVRRMIEKRVNSPLAHGAGRYFDAFGALGLGQGTSAFEGQVALAWNLAAAPGPSTHYPYAIDTAHEPWQIDLRAAARVAATEIAGGHRPDVVSARFHETLVEAAAETVRRAVTLVGPVPVVLTGGCFQNPRLAEGLLASLSAAGLEVHLHAEVPPGDGGISLGQAVIADALARKEG